MTTPPTAPQTIAFNIPTTDPGYVNGVFTIEPGSTPLPAITTPVVIEGSSQPGYSGTPIIQLDGRHVRYRGPVLDAGAAGSTIEGLDITDCGYGIEIDTTGVQVVGDYIGIDAHGHLRGGG